MFFLNLVGEVVAVGEVPDPLFVRAGKWVEDAIIKGLKNVGCMGGKVHDVDNIVDRELLELERVVTGVLVQKKEAGAAGFGGAGVLLEVTQPVQRNLIVSPPVVGFGEPCLSVEFVNVFERCVAMITLVGVDIKGGDVGSFDADTLINCHPPPTPGLPGRRLLHMNRNYEADVPSLATPSENPFSPMFQMSLIRTPARSMAFSEDRSTAVHNGRRHNRNSFIIHSPGDFRAEIWVAALKSCHPVVIQMWVGVTIRAREIERLRPQPFTRSIHTRGR